MHEIDDYDEDAFEEELGPSKSQRKREMAALQDMGKKLTELNKQQLDTVPMSEQLRRAIDLAHTLKSNEAKRRHLQFIGKVMRSEEIDPIRDRLEQLDSSSQAFANTLHQVESWRARLIEADDQEALTEFIENFPDCEIQTLRQLIRKAQHDVKTGKNTGAARKLFQFIRELCEGTAYQD